MQRFLKKAIALLAVYLLVLGSAVPALAIENARMRTVRVGYYHIEGYNVVDEDGGRSGYGYEVLQAMKLYNNWAYEYIGYDKGWADIQQMLLDGEIDMVISAVKTPAREELYDFSERPVSQSGACLLVKAGQSPYVAGQYEDYNGMRVGFIENSSQIASTEAFAKEKGFSYRPVYYKTSDELEQAVIKGTEVDAIVTSNMRIIAGTRRLEMYAMQDVHAMVQKGNTELLREIDYALEQISLYSPGLYDSLYSKYYSADAGDEVFFSPEERELIADYKARGEVLTAAIAPDMSPYSYYEKGQPKGILYDIAAEILRRTGLDYELITETDGAGYKNLIENRGVDIRLAASHDYNLAERLGYTLTDPYYSTDISRVTRKNNDGSINTIAVAENSAIESFYLPAVLENERIIRFKTVNNCVKAVLSGRCDAVYLYSAAAQEVVYSDDTNRLASTIMPGFTVSFSVGVREDADARLASILEKAAGSISEGDIAALELKYTDYSAQHQSFRGVVYSNPVLLVMLVALMLVLVFSSIFIRFINRKRELEREQNRQLQEALSSAEKANSAKSVFMSRMSHEIRTPLNAIIGYNSISSSRLESARSEPEYRQAASKAVECLAKSNIASKHLLTVINDVLDMSAIESGKIKISQEPFDFKNLVFSLTIMFFSQAKAKKVDFEVVFGTLTEEWFVGDEMRINQIITNLLSNAVKFTPEGGSMRLSISQLENTGEKAHIHFEVADTGIGMDKEFLTSIWSPFEQADASISRRFGGTGLGLSITKNLVDIMGGSITVESEIGKGSTFIAELPLKRMEQPEKDFVYDFSRMKILIADDDRSTCNYLKLLFERSGVRCTTVTSGAEAIAAVAEELKTGEGYTACLVDWCMPEMSGIDTIKRIKELTGEKLPIFIISAYDYSEIEESAREIGKYSFVAKPLFQSTVFDLLADISGTHRTAENEKPKGPDLAGVRILLVEDNDMNMEIAKTMLCSWNLNVDEAANGREAVAMFGASPPGTYRAILMDVHMPEIDGYRATEMIRASARADAKTVPIIAMTADVFAEDVSQALAVGMNDHIGKPIDQTLLLETLNKYIKN